MDSKRFDDVARSLYVAAPRRGALAILLGGALGLAGLAESAAKGKGKGKGKKKKKKKEIGCTQVAAACLGFVCGVGDSCCSNINCDCRQNLVCNLTTSEIGTCGCASGQEMHNGACGTKPQCIPAGQKREFFDIRCCSGSEITDIEDPAKGTCLPGVLSCLSDADCSGGSCRGYSCAAPILDCNTLYQ